MASVIFFDADGVLAIPYSYPEQPFPSILSTCQQLHDQGYILCVVSFNPRAQLFITRWGINHLFTAIRAGCNWSWNDTYNDQVHRIQLSKSTQIRNIMKQELKDICIQHSYFFDDDQGNISNIHSILPTIHTCLINHEQGFQMQHLQSLLDSNSTCLFP